MSKQTNYILGVVVIIVVAIVAYIGLNPQKEETVYTAPSTTASTSSAQTVTTASQTTSGGITSSVTSGGTTATTSGATTKPSGYTMADVAKHNSQASCWTAINGNVYDVTTWINQHPGGAEAILSLCGTDGSAAFNGQHGGQRRPEQELASFKIGALSK
jgi:cytochrome b involved in lipid metabolism